MLMFVFVVKAPNYYKNGFTRITAFNLSIIDFIIKEKEYKTNP